MLVSALTVVPFNRKFRGTKRLLNHTLRFERKRGDDLRVARTLVSLANANRMLRLPEEGVLQAKEALEIFERFGHRKEQAFCLRVLTQSFFEAKQLDAAEEAATRAIHLLTEKGEEFLVCQCHCALGDIHRFKGGREKAFHHFQMAFAIVSLFNWHSELIWIHLGLAELFQDENRFEDARACIERAKSHAVDDAYCLGRAMEVEAGIWSGQGRLEESRSGFLHAIENYEKVGASEDVGR